MASENESRKLINLRVIDLRSELEKRNIDRSGNKAVLHERLEKALIDEGHDPETYVFDLPEKVSSKRSKRGEGDESIEEDKEESCSEEFKEEEDVIQNEEDKNQMNNDNKVVEIKEPKVEENADTSEIENVEIKLDKISNEISEKPDKPKKEITSKPCPASRKPNRKITGDESSNTSELKTEPSDAIKKSPVKSAKTTPTKDKEGQVKDETQKEKSIPEANGIDNEDSINLTIGEDEEKLLADEADISQDKENKDESHSGAGQHNHSGAEKNQDNISGQDKDVKSGSTGDAAKDDKGKKPTSGSTSRNLWVSGLSSTTRATDLKQVFSKFGKVVGAKVVTNARTPGARCYGYVTMSSCEDATKAIESLHLTELHGRMISVEKAKGDSSGPPKRTESTRSEQHSVRKTDDKKKERVVNRSKSDEKKDDTIVPPGTEGDVIKTEPAAPGTEGDVSVDESDVKDKTTHRSRGTVKSDNRSEKRPRSTTSSHRSHDRNTSSKLEKTSPNVLTFSKIKEERDKQRLREKERMLREEERRRDNERQRQREVDRKQREEFVRIERERQKLKMERERVEREKNELLKLKRERQRLERERQRIEREKLEREKEELERLKRQTLNRLEEERRKRSLSRSRDHEYESSRKRPATENRYETTHSRFNDNSTRYVERTGGNFRNQSESVPARNKPDRHNRERYQDNTSKANRYTERPVESWHSGNVGIKSFSGGGGSGRDTWVSGASERKVDAQSWPRPPANSNRWAGGGQMNMNNRGPQVGPGSMFPPNMDASMPGLGMMAMGGPFTGNSGNRFDSYKLPY